MCTNVKQILIKVKISLVRFALFRGFSLENDAEKQEITRTELVWLFEESTNDERVRRIGIELV